MANSERPQAIDTPRNPIVSLRAPHCHSPQRPAQRFPLRPRDTVALHPLLPAAMPHHPDAVLGDHPLGRAALFAATKRGLHLFEGREIFLEPINMLLHLDDG